jgi:hypothetical protein
MHFCSFIGVYKRGPKHILYQARQLQFLIILSHILITINILIWLDNRQESEYVITQDPIHIPEGNTGGEYDTRGWINFHISWTRIL